MSEMKKHTPGPWNRNIRANGKYPVVYAGRNQHVATVSQQKDGAETEANIDLIADAPRLFEENALLRTQRDRLLEALKQCHDFPCVEERLFRKGNVPNPCPHCAAIEETEK